MKTDLTDSLVGFRTRRHRWVGGANAPHEAAWEIGPELLPAAPGTKIVATTPVWAMTAPLNLGLSSQAGGPEWTAPPPDGTDHIKGRISWALRNQNYQPTCIAEAVVACMELMQVKVPGDANDPAPIAPRLSVEFLYQKMRESGACPSGMTKPPPGWERGFTRLANAKLVLEGNQAIPLEPDCRNAGDARSGAPAQTPAECRFKPSLYWCLQIAEATGHGPPAPDVPQPPEAAQDGRHNAAPDTCKAPRAPAVAQRERGNARRIFGELQECRPVAIALPAFAEHKSTDMPNNWTRASVLLTGRVEDPQPNDKPVRGSGHAVCIVGFLPDNEEPLGGYFVFRNSMGQDFATMPPPSVLARGYGTISASHVEAHCWELLSLRCRDSAGS